MSTNIVSLAAQDIWSESSTQQHPLGALGETSDGRLFRYAKMGEAITIGRVAQSAPIDSATVKMSVTAAAAVGATSVSFTHAATTSTENEYAEGYLIVSYGTGIGQTLKIKSHAALTSGGASTVYLEDPLIVALDTTSRVDLAHNPWRGVLMSTSLVTTAGGGAIRSFTNAYYGWLQTRGVFGAFADGVAAAGYSFSYDASEDGSIDVTANDLTQVQLGQAIQASEDGYAHPVYLKWD